MLAFIDFYAIFAAYLTIIVHLSIKNTTTMKKLFPIFLLLVFGFAACTGGEGAQYAGKYKGTFTFIKQNGRTKPGTVAISNNPLSQNGVLLYYCLPLDYVSQGVYKTKSENVEYIAQVLSSIIGDNSYIDTTSEVVKDITVECTFAGSSMTMSVYYTVALLSDLLQTRVEIITFAGNK